MSFNLADKPLAERAALEDEKSRLFDLWQSNLGKSKGRRRGCSVSAPSVKASGLSGSGPNSTQCHHRNTPTWCAVKSTASWPPTSKAVFQAKHATIASRTFNTTGSS